MQIFLETERLVLRQFTEDDVDNLVELDSDPAVMQFKGSEPAIKEAGIEGVSIHDLRHAFASRMISRGVELVALASLMGHEDARITLSRYAHVYDKRRTDEAVRQAMAR